MPNVIEFTLTIGQKQGNLSLLKCREISLMVREIPLNFPESPAFFPNFPYLEEKLFIVNAITR